MISVDFHGLAISAYAPDSVLAALNDRVGHFPVSARSPSDIVFEYKVVSDLPTLDGPTRGWRPFYKPEKGSALYDAATDEIYLDSGEGTGALCKPRHGICTVSVVEPLEDKIWLLTHPFLTLPLMEMLKRTNRFAIHAAGVAREGRSILMCGTSGSGKTTLTVALVRAGYDFMGDDLTLLKIDSTIKALAFPEVIDITERSASFFPELMPLTTTPKPLGWVKQRLCVTDFYTSQIAWETTPAAILFPRVADEARSRLLPLRPTTALLELSSSLLLTEKRSTAAHMEALGKLTREVPCYQLLTGNDFDHIPELLGALL